MLAAGAGRAARAELDLGQRDVYAETDMHRFGHRSEDWQQLFAAQVVRVAETADDDRSNPWKPQHCTHR